MSLSVHRGYQIHTGCVIFSPRSDIPSYLFTTITATKWKMLGFKTLLKGQLDFLKIQSFATFFSAYVCKRSVQQVRKTAVLTQLCSDADTVKRPNQTPAYWLISPSLPRSNISAFHWEFVRHFSLPALHLQSFLARAAVKQSAKKSSRYKPLSLCTRFHKE